MWPWFTTGKSELSRRMAREYARVRGVPEGNLVSLDCPSANEISRKEYEDLIRAPLLRTAQEQRWWVPSGIASAPIDGPEDFCAGADGGPANEDTA